MLDTPPRDRVAIALGKPREVAAAAEGGPLAGIAIGAKVSPGIDAEIREPIAAEVYSMWLKADDWARGDVAWRLERDRPEPETGAGGPGTFPPDGEGWPAVRPSGRARAVGADFAEREGGLGFYEYAAAPSVNREP